MKHLFRFLPLVALGAIVLAGCSERNVTEYESRGRVVALTPESNSVTILHEEITGYQPSQETSFTPARAEDLEGLMVGDLVSFKIKQAEDGSAVIDDIEKLSADTQLNVVEPAPLEPVIPADSTLADTTLVLEDSVTTL